MIKKGRDVLCSQITRDGKADLPVMAALVPSRYGTQLSFYQRPQVALRPDAEKTRPITSKCLRLDPLESQSDDQTQDKCTKNSASHPLGYFGV
jgi:hypothetical protein